MARPRVMGSLKPSLSSSVCAKLAPSKPVSTTATAVIDASEPAPSCAPTGSASATVIHRGAMARASSDVSPCVMM